MEWLLPGFFGPVFFSDNKHHRSGQNGHFRKPKHMKQKRASRRAMQAQSRYRNRR